MNKNELDYLQVLRSDPTGLEEWSDCPYIRGFCVTCTTLSVRCRFNDDYSLYFWFLIMTKPHYSNFRHSVIVRSSIGNKS